MIIQKIKIRNIEVKYIKIHNKIDFFEEKYK
jgi:hypothetical protein